MSKRPSDRSLSPKLRADGGQRHAVKKQYDFFFSPQITQITQIYMDFNFHSIFHRFSATRCAGAERTLTDFLETTNFTNYTNYQDEWDDCYRITRIICGTLRSYRKNANGFSWNHRLRRLLRFIWILISIPYFTDFLRHAMQVPKDANSIF